MLVLSHPTLNSAIFNSANHHFIHLTAMHASYQNSITNPLYGHKWTDYYAAVEGRPPRETLLRALAQFNAEDSTAPALLLIWAVVMDVIRWTCASGLARLGN